ncbi:MAG: sugar ABC transporter substrate-binding protein [Thermomicrobiales bacterium]
MGNFPLRGMRMLLALLIVGGMLAACGGDDDDDAAGDATATAPSEVTATTAPQEATPTEAAEDTSTAAENAEAVSLRLGVSLTPAELEEFEQGLDAIRERHPNWDIQLEQTPQDGIVEKINTQIASDELPDVVQVQGLFAQPWIRQGAFASLEEMSSDPEFNVDGFYDAALDQFRWDGDLYGIPNVVAPDLVYLNLDMFEAAGVEPPSDDWTMDDLKELALELTLDSEGRNANDPDFDSSSVVQWGLSVTPNNIWTRHYLLPFGADPCANEDCTETQFSSPEVQEALQFWADLAQAGAAPYDPYTGNQTGVPGEGFQAGVAAIGINGFFLVGVLNDTQELNYDVVEFPTGPSGEKASPLSTNGWVIAETSENKDAAWQLIEELTSEEFLVSYWAEPGNGIPARESVAQEILNEDAQPANQQAILDTLEYAEVFIPSTNGAFEVFGRTSDIFIAMMKGDTSIEEGTAEIDAIAEEVFGANSQ